jgi:hypothetical protein
MPLFNMAVMMTVDYCYLVCCWDSESCLLKCVDSVTALHWTGISEQFLIATSKENDGIKELKAMNWISVVLESHFEVAYETVEVTGSHVFYTWLFPSYFTKQRGDISSSWCLAFHIINLIYCTHIFKLFTTVNFKEFPNGIEISHRFRGGDILQRYQ